MDEHVIIGMDPHKRTVTIEVMDAHEHINGHRQFTTDTAGFAEMLVFAGVAAADLGGRGLQRHRPSRC